MELFHGAKGPPKIQKLNEFLERVLGIDDARSIEYQRLHRMGKPRKENGRERIIIARFLRFSD